MNKLVIIGNGFDLAHGLKTSYKDFLVWSVNQSISNKDNPNYEGLINFSTDELPAYQKISIESIEQFHDFIIHWEIKPNYKYFFIERIFKASYENWVDIENEYFRELVNIYSDRNVATYDKKKRLRELNLSLEILKKELDKYLKLESKNTYINEDIAEHFKEIFTIPDSDISYIMVLNFNYTDNVEKYIYKFINQYISINYIHGKLYEEKNPIIFGYGDETDEHYEKIEKLNDNEYLKYMKSFAYLQTPNYKRLFDFLDKKDEKFDVYIMGHSLGLSDRLLFTHIFEHENFNSVKIYYYQKSELENDFYEKTQNISRYIRRDSRHRMRTKLVSFIESTPLVKYKFKPQN